MVRREERNPRKMRAQKPVKSEKKTIFKFCSVREISRSRKVKATDRRLIASFFSFQNREKAASMGCRASTQSWSLEMHDAAMSGDTQGIKKWISRGGTLDKEVV